MGLRPCQQVQSEEEGRMGKRKTNRLVGDEMTVFSQDISADLNNILVANRAAEELEHLTSGVLREESGQPVGQAEVGWLTSCSSSVLVTI